MDTKSMSLPWLRDLPSLDLVHLDGLSDDEKIPVLDSISKIFPRLMEDLGIQWKPHPVDERLRRELIDWMKSELEPDLGPANKKLIHAMDASVTYTERVFEGGDFKARLAVAKSLTLLIYLDEGISQDSDIENEAASLLIKVFTGQKFDNPYLGHLIKVCCSLSSCMSDPVAGNMILQSAAAFIEGCVFESRNMHSGGKYFKICDAEGEQSKDMTEYELAKQSFQIPRPFDVDHTEVDGHLLPHSWPVWMREKSAVSEVCAVTSFRAPAGIDIPTRLWLAAIPEMRHFIMYINDILSFPKELLDNDDASFVMVITRERRLIGMPGTAPDGGWCLRDTFEELYIKTISAGARINRLLRPPPEARYNTGGSVRTVTELVALLNDGGEVDVHKEDLMKALCMVFWETHQRGYVLYHFDSQRYRTYDLFGWAREMMGARAVEAPWWSSYFQIPQVARL